MAMPSETLHALRIDDVLALEEAGLLDAKRVELIDGMLFDKMAESAAHAAAVTRIARLLMKAELPGLSVRQERPVLLSDISAPEPDFSIVRSAEDDYASGHPRPSDVVALIEVAESSLANDLGPKAARYLAAGILAYSVFDVAAGELVRPEGAEPLPEWVLAALT